MATATSTIEICDMAILSRLIHPERGDLPLAAARALLKIQYEQQDIDRMNELAQKARDGTLTAVEQIEATEYSRLSHLLAAFHLKAKASLKKHGART